MNLEKRMEVERRLVRKLIRECKAAAWALAWVWDGEELVNVSGEDEALAAVFSVDESFIVFRKAVVPYAPMYRGAMIVLGNDGYDAIADASVSKADLPVDDWDAVMTAMDAFADKLELEVC